MMNRTLPTCPVVHFLYLPTPEGHDIEDQCDKPALEQNWPTLQLSVDDNSIWTVTYFYICIVHYLLSWSLYFPLWAICLLLSYIYLEGFMAITVNQLWNQLFGWSWYSNIINKHIIRSHGDRPKFAILKFWEKECDLFLFITIIHCYTYYPWYVLSKCANVDS